MYDDKPGEVVNATIAGQGGFQILFFKALCSGTSFVPGKQDNTSLFPLLAGWILSLLLKQCLSGLWNYKFHAVPPLLMGLNPDISYQQVKG